MATITLPIGIITNIVDHLADKDGQLEVKGELLVDSCSRSGKIYDSLYKSPIVASKVTKLVVKSESITHWVEILKLCSNLTCLVLENENPWGLLQQFNQEKDKVIPKIQDIQVLSKSRKVTHTSTLWTCLLDHKESITKLDIDCWLPFFRQRNIVDYISGFSKLEELCLRNAEFEDFTELLLQDKTIQKLRLNNVCYMLPKKVQDPRVSKINIKEFTMSAPQIHVDVLRLLIDLSSKLERLEVRANMILQNRKQNHKEVYNILKRFPGLPEEGCFVANKTVMQDC